MKKVLAMLLGLSAVSVFADNVVYCDEDMMNSVTANRDAIKQAFIKSDGCKAGKLQVKNHKIIQANLACFPNYQKNQYNIFHVMDSIDKDALAENNPKCDAVRNQVMANHQKTKIYLSNGDGCNAGKTQLATHSLIQANMGCFPKYQKDINYVTSAASKYNASAADAD